MKGLRQHEFFPAGKIQVGDFVLYEMEGSDNQFLRKIIFVEDMDILPSHCVVTLGPISFIWNEVRVKVDFDENEADAFLHSLGDLPTLINHEGNGGKHVRVAYDEDRTSSNLIFLNRARFHSVGVRMSPTYPNDMEIVRL